MSRDKQEWTNKAFKQKRSECLLRDNGRCYECSKSSKSSNAFVPNKTKEWKGNNIPQRRTLYVIPKEDDPTRRLQDFELHELITLCHRCYWKRQE